MHVCALFTEWMPAYIRNAALVCAVHCCASATSFTSDFLVSQCTCSFVANSTCSIKNSSVQTAGKFGHVRFCCNSLRVCMERRSRSERTRAGQCTIQTDSQTMNIPTGVATLKPWPHIQETAVLKARSYQNRNSILKPRTWPKQYPFCKQRYVQNSRYSPSANT